MFQKHARTFNHKENKSKIYSLKVKNPPLSCFEVEFE